MKNIIKLSNLISLLHYEIHDIAISDKLLQLDPKVGITIDSRNASNSVYFAIQGETLNGNDFIQSAISAGAVACITDSQEAFNNYKVNNIPIIYCKNCRKSVAAVAKYLFKQIDIQILAVTGTNGKTTTSIFAQQIINSLGYKCAYIGTIGGFIGSEQFLPEGLTTLDPIKLLETLIFLQDKHVKYLILEASSHGLKQLRLDGIDVICAGFTNISPEHLDYHKTMDDYVQSKQHLFTNLLSPAGAAVVNIDDSMHNAVCPSSINADIMYYGKSNPKANYYIHSIQKGERSTSFTLNYNQQDYPLTLNIAGEFNVDNVVCALAMVMQLQIANIKQILSCVPKIHSAQGRMEIIAQYSGADIIVDFAHTADALQKILTIFKREKLHVIFGCGGDRYAGKRKEMGQVAMKYAHKVYLTSDNSRNEDINNIIDDILVGVKQHNVTEGKDYFIVPDRYLAITKAITLLKPGETLIVAGMGHQSMQTIKNKKVPWLDSRAILEIIDKLKA